MVKMITKNFMKRIRDDAEKGVYRVALEGVSIDVFPYVFPPQSPFSESSLMVYDQFKDLSNKKVLDIGSGTGIQSIYAARSGALNVDAVDIMDYAVKCTKHNAKLNGVEINSYQSDLFSNVEGRFDLIIANLPIVEAEEGDLRFHSLIDLEFEYHRRLFEEASDYLEANGRIVLCHANLSDDDEFGKLEKLAHRIFRREDFIDMLAVNLTKNLKFEFYNKDNEKVLG